jgi:hypothetical protein
MNEQDPKGTGPRLGMSEEQERVRALTAFLREQEERADAALLAEERQYQRSRVRRGTLVVLWIGIAYVWLGTPSWLTVEAPPDQTIAEEAEALRLNVFLQTQQIQGYLIARGRLPYVLEEAGPPFIGMQYNRRDSRSYELHGISSRVDLLYESETPPLEFVGRAADLLEGSPLGVNGG